MADGREKGLQDYRKKLLEHKEVDGRLKECKRHFNAIVGRVAVKHRICCGEVHITV